MSPTSRSMALLRQRGYLPYVVEKWNAYTKHREDLYGFLDVVAIQPGEMGVLGVQVTTGSNVAARVKKAQGLRSFTWWLAAGNPVEFHGWRKVAKVKGGKMKVWQPIIRVYDMRSLIQ